MDHLQKAVELIESSEEGVLMEYSTLELRQLEAQQAFTHAVIALVQRVDRFIEEVENPKIKGWFYFSDDSPIPTYYPIKK